MSEHLRKAIRVLLIEDDLADADLLRELLSGEKNPSFEVALARQLSEGLERLRRGGIDVVLLDMSLPDSMGVETASRVSQQFPSVPIVVLTGLDDETFALDVVRSGAQDYLVKGHVDGNILSRVMRYAIERKRSEEALRESEERNRLIVQTANDAFIEMDAAGFVTDWNHQAEILFGWSRAEALGRPFAQTMISLADQEAYLKGIENFLNRADTTFLNKRIELMALRRSEREFPAQLSVWPIHVGGGYRFNAFVQDITERRRMERLKEEFVGTVSHELRTPLTIVKEGVNLMLDGISGSINEEQKSLLREIDGNVNQLIELINNLLDLSKMRAGYLHLVRQKVDLQPLIEEVVKRHQLIAGRRTFEIEIEKVSPVFCDPDRMHQILGNFLSNAVKFTREDGNIALSLQERNGYVTVSIRDDGIGISKEDLSKLFKRFSQVGRELDQYRGTGLGLALCKELMELHGGRISVSSTPKKGSVFTAWLPRYSVAFTLEESFNALSKAAPGGKPESVGMIVFMPESLPADAVEEIEATVRSSIQRADVLLNLKPHGWVCLALTDAAGLNAMVERLRFVLSEGAQGRMIHVKIGTGLYPADAPDVHSLFAKVMKILENPSGSLEYSTRVA